MGAGQGERSFRWRSFEELEISTKSSDAGVLPASVSKSWLESVVQLSKSLIFLESSNILFRKISDTFLARAMNSFKLVVSCNGS